MFLNACLLSQKPFLLIRIRQTMQLSIRLRCTNIRLHKPGLREGCGITSIYTVGRVRKGGGKEGETDRDPGHQ